MPPPRPPQLRLPVCGTAAAAAAKAQLRRHRSFF